MRLLALRALGPLVRASWRSPPVAQPRRALLFCCLTCGLLPLRLQLGGRQSRGLLALGLPSRNLDASRFLLTRDLLPLRLELGRRLSRSCPWRSASSRAVSTRAAFLTRDLLPLRFSWAAASRAAFLTFSLQSCSLDARCFVLC